MKKRVLFSAIITACAFVVTLSQPLFSVASETNTSVVAEVTPQATSSVDSSATATPERYILAADGLMPSIGKVSKMTTESTKLSVEYEWDNCYLVLSLNEQYPPIESRDYVDGRYMYYFDEPLKLGTELSISMGRDAEMHVEEKDGKITEIHMGWFSPDPVDTYVGLQKPKVTKVNVKKQIIKGKCYAGSTIKVYFKKATTISANCFLLPKKTRSILTIWNWIC